MKVQQTRTRIRSTFRCIHDKSSSQRINRTLVYLHVKYTRRDNQPHLKTCSYIPACKATFGVKVNYMVEGVPPTPKILTFGK